MLKTVKLQPKEKLSKIKKPKQKKRKRLIIRNLSFKVDEEALKEIFSKFGKLIDVKIPLKTDGKKRGFAFVEYEDTKSLIQAMKTMNYKEIHGRKVAIDFAMDKTKYQLKLQDLRKEGEDYPHVKKESQSDSAVPKVKTEKESDSEVDSDKSDQEEESEEEDEDEKRLNAFLKEFDSGADALTKPQRKEKMEESSSSESSSEESDEEEEEHEESDNKRIKKEFKRENSQSPSKKLETKKRDSQDVSEGKTVFLRNVSFMSSEESIGEVMQEYGECEYCLLCMDPVTDHPRGTAFVKFKEKSSADELIMKSNGEPGIVVDGRKLTCSYAISREDIVNIGEASKKPKDKRNLNLLRVGLIMPNSKESEGVSQSDMTRRFQLEILKKQKLKNVNFFVSDKRLIIHNLPRNFSDETLRQLLKKAAGRGAVITEARVMKEFSKTDSQGKPLSKGFGFVSFSTHEDALKALNELNNNPKTFTPQKRPIVEFAVESKMALLSKERRREKMQMRNKRRTEEKNERQLKEAATGEKKDTKSPSKNKKRKNKKTMTPDNKKRKQDVMTPDNTKRKQDVMTPDNKKRKQAVMHETENLSESNSQTTKQKKKGKQRQRKKGKKNIVDKSNQDNMSNLINKYKDKLINKIT